MNMPTMGATGLGLSVDDKMEIDNRSIYVGNVDYGATAEELEAHFHGCGAINRVTILCNKADGHPKGFAYIEFSSKDFVETALAMNDTLFRGRQIKVLAKRTNRPGLSTTNRFPRGSLRGRGRGTGRGGACCHTSFRGSRRPMWVNKFEVMSGIYDTASGFQSGIPWTWQLLQPILSTISNATS